MKRISILIFVLVFVSLAGCTKEDPVRDEGFTEVLLPDFMRYSLKSGSVAYEIVEGRIIALDTNGNEVTGRIRLTFPVYCDGSLIKLEISNNIFEQTELSPEFLLKAFETKEKEVHDFIEEGFAACLDRCRPMTEGRGACRLDCWGDMLITAAVAIGTAIIIDIVTDLI